MRARQLPAGFLALAPSLRKPGRSDSSFQFPRRLPPQDSLSSPFWTRRHGVLCLGGPSRNHPRGLPPRCVAFSLTDGTPFPSLLRLIVFLFFIEMDPPRSVLGGDLRHQVVTGTVLNAQPSFFMRQAFPQPALSPAKKMMPLASAELARVFANRLFFVHEKQGLFFSPREDAQPFSLDQE